VAAKLLPWPQDVLRHTFATMDFALNQDAPRLQAKLGHTKKEDTLFSHYRAFTMADGRPVTKSIAAEVFAIVPPPAAFLAEPGAP